MTPTTNLRILVPEATTNYIKNPAIRSATTGWTAVGSAISRGKTEARFGFSSLEVDTNGAARNEGAYFRVSDLEDYDSVATASAYVRGTGLIRIRLINSGGNEWASQPIDLSSSRWTRIEITGRVQTNDDVRVYIETEDDANQDVTFHVDGVQLELLPHSTTFCDGEQEGCRWSGLFDDSTSSRSIKTRRGGKWVSLAGPCRGSDDNIYVTFVGGAGMPPITNNIQPYATLPGSYHQNIKVGDRVMTFTFYVKDATDAGIKALHELKQQIIDIVKPDRTYGNQPFTLEYDDGKYPLYIEAHYDGGMSGSWDLRNQWSDNFPIRMLAVDPFWYEDNQELDVLDYSDTEGDNTVGIARKSGVDGSWDFLPIADDINKIVEGSDGTLYFGSQDSDKIYTYDFDTLTSVGLPAGKNAFNDFAVGLDGYIYAVTEGVGVFYHDGAAWNDISPAAASQSYGIVVNVDGDVYICGAFTTADWPFMRYDGTTWHFPAAGSGASFAVTEGRRIAISPDRRYIYVTGSFTLTYDTGQESGGVLKYDIESDDLLDEVGDADSVAGTPIGTQFLFITQDNRLYSNNTGNDNVMYFNGATWTTVSPPDGIDFTVAFLNNFATEYKGAILMGGENDGSTDNNTLLLYKNTVFLEMDFRETDLTNGISGLLVTDNGDLIIGSRTGSYAGSTTVKNIGSAEVDPKVYVKGYGILNNIENGTSDVRVFLDTEVESDEELVVDFGAGSIMGALDRNRMNTLQSGSDLTEFSLLPGDNVINLFVRNDVGAEARIAYVPRHWSVDAINRGEEM